MATRLHGRAVRRPSLPLTLEDEATLVALKASPEMLSVLKQLANSDIDLQSATESALLHAIFRAGMATVRDVAADAGYAELANQNGAEADERRAVARRRRPSWADEP